VNSYESWGGYPKTRSSTVIPMYWPETIRFDQIQGSVLPYGLGRSYGDSCLNDGGILIDTSRLDRFISFDDQSGILRCEAGVTFEEILDLFVPRGWFLPVTPGTRHVTVGGAIANDVHGKNHHRAGTFGCHVRQLELLTSDRQRIVCSSHKNVGLFSATIGGLGLTGVILWAEVRLKPITGPWITMETIPFESLNDFFELSISSDAHYEYTVAWVDCLVRGAEMGRGIFMRGNHADSAGHAYEKPHRLRIPCNAPSILMNRLAARAFNTIYYRMQPRGVKQQVVPYESFFYPLDRVSNWNRLYGKSGFLQYQCVIGKQDAAYSLKEILTIVANSGLACFLGVLKQFGSVVSPGLLSFPRAGATLALDVPFRGSKTLRLLDELDKIVRDASGGIYPAKDARMAASMFRFSYPRWETFVEFIDPCFSSSFWRRVSSGGNACERC
jgi:FAD/FMN-containing dehydrogenase